MPRNNGNQKLGRRAWTAAVSLIAALGLGPPSAGAEGTAIPEMSDLSKIRGVVRPAAQAVLSSQIQARIEALPFKEGQRFDRGSILVRLDCAKYLAELAAARAEHEARKKTLINNLGLIKLNAIGDLEIDMSKAEVKKSLAGVKVAAVNVRGCRVRAPFSGRVVQLMVHEHESVFPNDQLLSILDDTRLEIELILPSKALAWLKRGTAFEFLVDETGLSYAAAIDQIGANVDPVSQTVRVIGVFSNHPARVLAGMSGTAHFLAETP